MITFIISIVAYIWLFWCAYVLVMGLYRAHLNGRLTGLNRIMAYPAVGVGYAMDIFANLVIAPIIFLDFPKEFLVTARLKRYMSAGTGWRYKVAEYVCNHVLDVFDPKGDHC